MHRGITRERRGIRAQRAPGFLRERERDEDATDETRRGRRRAKAAEKRDQGCDDAAHPRRVARDSGWRPRREIAAAVNVRSERTLVESGQQVFVECLWTRVRSFDPAGEELRAERGKPPRGVADVRARNIAQLNSREAFEEWHRSGSTRCEARARSRGVVLRAAVRAITRVDDGDGARVARSSIARNNAQYEVLASVHLDPRGRSAGAACNGAPCRRRARRRQRTIEEPRADVAKLSLYRIAHSVARKCCSRFGRTRSDFIHNARRRCRHTLCKVMHPAARNRAFELVLQHFILTRSRSGAKRTAPANRNNSGSARGQRAQRAHNVVQHVRHRGGSKGATRRHRAQQVSSALQRALRRSAAHRRRRRCCYST